MKASRKQTPPDQTIPEIRDVRFLREWPAFALIVVFVAVLMWPFSVGGQALMPDTWRSIHPWARGVDLQTDQTNIYDTVLEYGPWFEYAQKCLKEGRVPHWNPWQFCGAPLYANRLIPFFYPPFILAALISSPPKLIGWLQFFNLILSGWGMYLLLRRWRMTPSIGAASSCLYLTCGVHFLPFPLWTLGTIGFPWLLWALDGFLERPTLRTVAPAGLIAGFILMVGYPVLVVHLSYFTAIYFIARWWSIRRTGPGHVHWTIPLLTLAAICILGFGVSAIANVPAWAYSRQTVRQVESFADRAFEREKRLLITPPEEAGLDPIAARFGERADMLLPINGRGTQRAWQYGGVLLYLLAFLGILAGRPQARLLGILGLLFAIPVFIPEVYLPLLTALPGWTVTILLPIEVVNLIVCLLAACGLEAILGGNWKPDLLGRIVFAGLTVAAIFLTWKTLVNAPVINLPILYFVPDRDLLARSRFHVYYLTTFGALGSLTAIAAFMPRRMIGARWALVGAMIVFSLSTFWYLQPVYSPANYMPAAPFTEWLRTKTQDGTGDPAGNRLARWADLPLPFNPQKRSKSPFTPNLQLEYCMMDVGGYDSLVPKRFIDYCTLFEDAIMDYRALIAFRAPSTMYHQRFRDLGVRWILSQGELSPESRQGCRLAWDDRLDGSQQGTNEPDDFIQVWEIENPAPRAFLTRRVAFSNHPFEDPLVLATNLLAQGIRAVVVEDPTRENRTFAFPEETPQNSELALPDGDVRFETDKPEDVGLSVHAPQDCYLVLRDGWFPEWRAFMDGKEIPMYPADGAFRAVYVPSGEHVVEFKYDARSFRLGMLITIGTLLLLIVIRFHSPGGYTRNIRPTA